jgi:hypothetical protein
MRLLPVRPPCRRRSDTCLIEVGIKVLDDIAINDSRRVAAMFPPERRTRPRDRSAAKPLSMNTAPFETWLILHGSQTLRVE